MVIAAHCFSAPESGNTGSNFLIRLRIWTTLYVLVALHLRITGSEDLRPVWQWIDPGLKGNGTSSWPNTRPQGEVKSCTCAFVDNNQKCIDSDALGLRASFPCGYANYRNRAGNDEKMFGMRPISPCYCTFNQG